MQIAPNYQSNQYSNLLPTNRLTAQPFPQPRGQGTANNCCAFPPSSSPTQGLLQQAICQVVQSLTQTLVGLIEKLISSFTGDATALNGGAAGTGSSPQAGTLTGEAPKKKKGGFFSKAADFMGSVINGGKQVFDLATNVWSLGSSLLKMGK